MLAGGSEAALCPLGIAGFIASQHIEAPTMTQKASRPFDPLEMALSWRRSYVLVLENLERAWRAHIYGEIVGYGATGDAYHITAPAPEGEGAQRAMKAALQDAGIEPEDVQYINAHGTSTDYNDKYESRAIELVFGEHAQSLAVSSTKALTGHMLGAAGAVEAPSP